MLYNRRKEFYGGAAAEPCTASPSNMEDSKYDVLKLENQICFPLYACAKEVVRKYKPYLDEIGLTYTQYIAMMVMWEHKRISVKELGSFLYLDSGTLTPLLKKLEQKGYVSRARDSADERVLNVTITEAGEALKDRAVTIPARLAACVELSIEDAVELGTLLKKLLKTISYDE